MKTRHQRSLSRGRRRLPSGRRAAGAPCRERAAPGGRRAVAGVLFAALLLQALPCGADPAVRIGVSLGLTGRFAVIAQALERGFAIWEGDVNRQGGMLGRPVRVIVRDDHGEPDLAREIYRGLIEKDAVDFLFAPYSSLITAAVLPIAEESGIPVLIAGAAADSLWEQGYRNAVGIYTPASKFPVGFLELLVLKGLDGITVVGADDPFSAGLAESVKKWSRRFGLTILASETFPKGTRVLDAFAARARDNGSRVLMVCGHMNEAVNMVGALKTIGWRPRAFYASVGPALQAFHDRCGPDAEGVFGTSLWEPRSNYPGARAFYERFVEAYGETPGYHAGLAYAAGQVLEKAVTEAKSLDRSGVRKALFNLDTMTIIGRFGVDRTGKQVRQHTFIIQWQNGRKQLVWPQPIQTAEPLF